MSKSPGKKEKKEEQKKHREQRAKAELEAKIKKTRGYFIGGAIALIAAVSFVGLAIYDNYAKNNGIYLRKQIAMSSGSTEINNAMYSFILDTYYINFKNTNASQLSSYGLDTSKSLKEQYYSADVTWFDYFSNTVSDRCATYLRFSEEAKSKGIALTEEQKQTLRSDAEKINLSEYTKGLSVEDIYNVYSLEALCTEYEKYIYEEADINDEKLEAYYEEHTKDYLVVDFLSCPIYYAVKDTDKLISKDDALKYANRLEECESVDEYEDVLSEYLVEQYAYSGEELEKKLDAAMQTLVYTSVNADFAEWSTDSARHAGDKYFYNNEEGGAYTVFYLTELPHKDTSPNGVNVRHILVDDNNSYNDSKDGEAIAEAIYNEWKNGEATEESFAELAGKYSEDSGSKNDGGLYEALSEGKTVKEFNDWSFDKSRKSGDTEIIKTEFGWHIMYFCGQGNEKWADEIRSILKSEVYDSTLEELEGKYEISKNDSIIRECDL